MTSIPSVFDDRNSAWVVETPSGTSADANRAVSLVAALNGLAPSIRRELLRSVALPIDYSTDGGLLRSVTLDPSWSSPPPALRAASGAWTGLTPQDLALEAVIDAVDTWSVLLSIGMMVGAIPSRVRPVFEGRPRTLFGVGSWSVTASPWGGATRLPTRVSVARALGVLGDILDGFVGDLPRSASDRLGRFEWNPTAEAPSVSVDRLDRLAEELRRDRSVSAIEVVLRSRLADGSARMLEREVSAHVDQAEGVLGSEAIALMRNQRAVERSYEAMTGRDRAAAERTSRMTASPASRAFYLDLIPEGRHDTEVVESVDLDRRFVEGDSDWVVRRVSRGDVDLSDLRLAATTRVAAEELLARHDPPSIGIADQRWHTSDGEYIVTVEAECDPGVRVTAVKFVIIEAGARRELIADLTQPDGSIIKVGRVTRRLAPGASIVVSAQWAWRLGGVEALGVSSAPQRIIARDRPSAPSEFVGRVAGRDGDEAAVAETRRRLARIVGVSLLLGGAASGLLVWGDDLVDLVLGAVVPTYSAGLVSRPALGRPRVLIQREDGHV